VADEPANGASASRPFYRLLGLDVDESVPAGSSRIVLTSRHELENSRRDVHGGAIAALLDAAVSVAVRSACKAGEGAATISLTVNYVGTARGTLIARGRAIRVGRTIASAEALAVDASDTLVAHAVATLRIIAPTRPR
jgi:uncharacterized protein (TIGR00369 family)